MPPVDNHCVLPYSCPMLPHGASRQENDPHRPDLEGRETRRAWQAENALGCRRAELWRPRYR
jgi:hypothetical protein